MSEILQQALPFLIVSVIVAAVWLLLRNKATALETTDDLDARIGNGRPVVLKFFKNT